MVGQGVQEVFCKVGGCGVVGDLVVVVGSSSSRSSCWKRPPSESHCCPACLLPNPFCCLLSQFPKPQPTLNLQRKTKNYMIKTQIPSKTRFHDVAPGGESLWLPCNEPTIERSSTTTKYFNNMLLRILYFAPIKEL